MDLGRNDVAPTDLASVFSHSLQELLCETAVLKRGCSFIAQFRCIREAFTVSGRPPDRADDVRRSCSRRSPPVRPARLLSLTRGGLGCSTATRGYQSHQYGRPGTQHPAYACNSTTRATHATTSNAMMNTGRCCFCVHGRFTTFPYIYQGKVIPRQCASHPPHDLSHGGEPGLN
jgi:hypothetical protein